MTFRKLDLRKVVNVMVYNISLEPGLSNLRTFHRICNFEIVSTIDVESMRADVEPVKAPTPKLSSADLAGVTGVEIASLSMVSMTCWWTASRRTCFTATWVC